MEPNLLDHSPVDKDQALSVSQLTLLIKDMLEGAFPDIWIKGELSNVRTPPSGHVYATLKDENAQIKLVMFRHQARRQNGKQPFDWKDGVEVLVKGKISVYGPQGSYQILASFIEPVGSGALHAQFEALKEKLSEKGLFDEAHKTSIPFLPRRVGVVTSPKSAAIRDILNIIHRRFPLMAVDVYPALVQGAEAPHELINALQLADRLGRVDVIILGRGGGSMEDLWCFNDEALAEAIFNCQTPVVSAVGHEIDFTIADFVSDQRAPTPSAAAELVVPEQSDLQGALKDLQDSLSHSMGLRLSHEKKHLETLFHQLEHPRHKLDLQKQKLENYLHILTTSMMQQLRQSKDHLLRLQDSLIAMNPKSVISRGYALVSRLQTGSLVTSSKKVKLKEKLRVTFADGPVDVKVEDTPLL